MALVIEYPLGDKNITLKSGDLAFQASSAVTISLGETVVLVTVCMAPEPREGVDFLPLTVDYEERLYAVGKIPGSFFRREGRPGQAAILSGRLTDRLLRPLFPKGFSNEVQVIATVLSVDQENSPEVLASLGASAALVASEIPFNGPVGTVRIGMINGEFIINPSYSQLQVSSLDLVVSSTKDAVVMIEAGAKEVSEEVISEAIAYAHDVNQQLIALQDNFRAQIGKPKVEFKPKKVDSALEAAVLQAVGDKFTSFFGKNKIERDILVEEFRKEIIRSFANGYPEQDVAAVLEAKLKADLRSSILDRGMRPDGRKQEDIRSIQCEVGVLPRTHGSGLFTRGLTQVLNIATLGSVGDEQTLDGLILEETKRFMHHYNFPPYSTGEAKRVGTPGRREVGHGALVEKALSAVIPPEGDFPYTIRLVSEVLSSNGSTSMASVCSGTLSLMDAGIPIKAPVAGIAMGLVTGEDSRFAVLTDLEGMEDAYGDMDFKIAGTAAGITAVQLDIKIRGLRHEIIVKTLEQARTARLYILERIRETIAASRPTLSKYAPRMVKINIDPSKIGAVIGPGGRMIRAIIEKTKASVDVEDDGSVYIGATDVEAAERAIAMIEALTKEVEVGGIYTGKVTRILPFGALVEILPGKEGMVHISELADYRVPSVEDIVKVGDEITVMVKELDRAGGKISLSRRAVFQSPEEAARPRGPKEPPQRRHEERGPRPGGRGPESRPRE